MNITENLEYYVNDISTSFFVRLFVTFSQLSHAILSLFLVFLIWILSYVLYWFVGLILKGMYFCIDIERNEKRTDLKTLTHYKLTRYKIPRIPDVRGLTYNRIYFYQLIISWFAFFFMTVGVLIAERAYLVILATPLCTTFGFFIYRGSFSDRLTSFVSRFYVLYYDFVRIGEALYIRDNNTSTNPNGIYKMYIIRDITIFDIVLECVEGRALEIQKFSVKTDFVTTLPTIKDNQTRNRDKKKFKTIPIHWLTSGGYPSEIIFLYK